MVTKYVGLFRCEAFVAGEVRPMRGELVILCNQHQLISQNGKSTTSGLKSHAFLSLFQSHIIRSVNDSTESTRLIAIELCGTAGSNTITPRSLA